MSTSIIYAQMPRPQQWSTHASTAAIENLPVRRIVTVQNLTLEEPTTSGTLVIQESDDEDYEEEEEQEQQEQQQQQQQEKEGVGFAQLKKPLPKIPSFSQRAPVRSPFVMQDLREAFSWDRRLEPIVEDQDTTTESDIELSDAGAEEEEPNAIEEFDPSRDSDPLLDQQHPPPVVRHYRSSDGWRWSTTSQTDLSQSDASQISKEGIILPASAEDTQSSSSIHKVATERNAMPTKQQQHDQQDKAEFANTDKPNIDTIDSKTEIARDLQPIGVTPPELHADQEAPENAMSLPSALNGLGRKVSKELLSHHAEKEPHDNDTIEDENSGFTAPISYVLQQQQHRQASLGALRSSTSLCSRDSSISGRPRSDPTCSPSVMARSLLGNVSEDVGWNSVRSSRLCPCTRYDSHEAGCIFATGPSSVETGFIPLQPSRSTPLSSSGESAGSGAAMSRLSIASFSLTHDKDAIKTYRRMAAKTHDREVQMTYANYLLKVAAMYEDKNHPQNATRSVTRRRLLEEAEYWIDRLAKAGKAEALLMKGRWLLEGPESGCVSDSYQRVQPTKAARCFQTAAKAGCVDAEYELARYWKQREEISKAMACYKSAASKGHTMACYVN
ncbi:hypothetical protein EC973_007871 [Apophysomyces ossiformis]|uniref:Uncharacterized protein n=1 Tax=Apophysomyces ossiformis TaxID=679940 RepID=A0A8H7BPD2_9FUNG|nr:hypothetical protein EC973_007871 [Apophysomyces ossiformis]